MTYKNLLTLISFTCNNNCIYNIQKVTISGIFFFKKVDVHKNYSVKIYVKLNNLLGKSNHSVLYLFLDQIFKILL